jgi:hypothetical protein
MKVERKGVFTQITITIENEEEATLLWHTLNTPSYRVRETSQNYKYDVDTECYQEQWRKYNNVFNPTEEL